MVVRSPGQDFKGFRYRLALIIFGVFLVWPLIHIVMVNTLGISTWRFFGWGMYATPNPEAQSRLRVVIRDKANTKTADIAQLHESLTRLSVDAKQESLCINMFLEDVDQILQKMPRNGLCKNEAAAAHLDYFMHFRSTNHLSKFIKEALSRSGKTGSEAYAFLTHQRFNIFQNQAYLESDVYRIWGDEVQYLGKITNQG